MSDRWDRVKALFAEAAAISGEARRAFLARACEGDAELLAEVQALLDADEAADPRLERSAVAAVAAELVSAEEPIIGPYRLLEKIGEGGMGEVWLAEQAAPLRRKVAIKVIKLGMDTRQVVARFEAERQALALMDHPAIAKVHDAGSTPAGRPYFVMEYVDGVAITEHCDRHGLTLRERLALFLPVCDGVQHAHQKAVLHRDLKPSNVLVSLHDGTPVPKIIDFGILKATGAKLADRTMYTEIGMLIGTPEYMSPEQAENHPDIDTRTDVYSLGVLLYEQLVGALPFETQHLRQATPEGIVRKIRQEEPPRPSKRLSTLGARSTDSARRRHTTLPALRRELKGDLDVIAMKALEKAREDRYGSPAELAADIRRYLANQPILARPPSTVYQLRKMFQRNRLLFGATGVVLLVVLASSIVSWTLYVRARTESRKSEQVATFMTDMLSAVGPSVARGRDTTMLREILDRTAERIDVELAGQPEVEATLRFVLGRTYKQLNTKESVPHLEQAIALSRQSRGDLHPETLRALQELGEALVYNWRPAEAIPILREALAGRRSVFGPEHPETLNTATTLAAALRVESFAEADRLLRDAWEAQRRVLGPEHPDTLGTRFQLGRFAYDAGRFDEALEHFRAVVDGHRRQSYADETAILGPLSWVGLCLQKLSRAEEALVLGREALEMARRLYGERSETACLAMSQLGGIYMKLGRPAEAEPLFAESVAGLRESRGAGHELPLNHTVHLGRCLTALGRYAEAEKLLLENHPRLVGAVGTGSEYARRSAQALVDLYEAWGRPERARLYAAAASATSGAPAAAP